MNYISIITNFGCHYKCPYCIVKKNNLHIPRTTLAGLDSLEKALKETRCNIISISGGGDPLYEYEKHVDWYRKLFGIVRKCHINGSICSVPVEMHTSYMTDETSFPFYDCFRVVYHANSIDQLSHIRRIGDEITRAVFVVTADYTIADIMDIALFVKNSSEIDELSFRQWGWLQNNDKSSPTNFYHVNGSGGIGAWGASAVTGVRLAFLIATCRKIREEAETCHS